MCNKRKNGKTLMLCLLLSVFNVVFSQTDNDSIVQKRVLLFLENQVQEIANKITTKVIGVKLPPIKGSLTRQVYIYESFITFFTLLIGMKDEDLLSKINKNDPISIKAEKIKNNIHDLYSELGGTTSKEFLDYSYISLGKSKKTGTIRLKNNSDTSWTIKLYSTNRKKYETINPGEEKVIQTDLSTILIFLMPPQKYLNEKFGTWFPKGLCYDGESYEIKKENNQYMLLDNSTKQIVKANSPILVNTTNTL